MERACRVLNAAKRIAVLGASSSPDRTSHAIASYLQNVGYTIIPVNPNETEVLGEPSISKLSETQADIVDVFRNASHQFDVRDAVLAMDPLPTAVWFQLNAGGQEVEQELESRGIAVFVDSCIKVVHSLCQRDSA